MRLVAIARLLLAALCGGQGLATVAIDLNRTHATNPEWLRHARFHLVWQVVSYALLSVLEVALIVAPGPLERERFYLAAILAGIPMVSCLAAFFTRKIYGAGYHAIRVIRSNQEEHGGVDARGHARAPRGDVHRVHVVLVVAGRAQNLARGRLAEGDKETIVDLELSRRASRRNDLAAAVNARARPGVRAARGPNCRRTNRVVVMVAAVGAKQCRGVNHRGRRSVAQVHGLIRRALHHRYAGQVAIVAAEAEQDARGLIGAVAQRARRIRIRRAVTEIEGVAREERSILTPEGEAAAAGGQCAAVGLGAAVRGVAAYAATAIHKVGAQDVRRRRATRLGNRQHSGGHNEEKGDN